MRELQTALFDEQIHHQQGVSNRFFPSSYLSLLFGFVRFSALKHRLTPSSLKIVECVFCSSGT